MDIRKFFRTKGAALFQTFVGTSPGTAGAVNNLGINESPFLLRIFQSADLATFFNTAFKSAIIIGGMLAVIKLGYAGFVYMTTDVWSSKQSAKDIITDSTLGLLLLLSIWLILNQINPNLLNLNVLQSVTPAQSGPTRTQNTNLNQNSNMQQFTNPPAQNSFFGGAGNQFDSSLQGCGVSGCGNQSDQFAPGLF